MSVRRNIALVLLSFQALLLAGCATRAVGSLDDAASYSAEHHGLAVLVSQNGRLIYERYDNGYSRGSSNHLHSATKSFWGPVIAAMIEDGILSSFDELVSNTIIEWRQDPAKQDIRIRHLLDLSSGLAEDIRALQGERGYAKDKYSYAVSSIEKVAPAGSRFRYGPSNYYVLGELMKRRLSDSGISPLRYLKDRVLSPIGANVASWIRDGSGNPHIPNGASFTARDWLKFGELMLNRGSWHGKQIIRADLLDQCFLPSRANPGYGLTFWLNRPGGIDYTHKLSDPRLPGGTIYSGGLPDLFAALGAGVNALYIIPSKNMVVVRQAKAPWAGRRRSPPESFSSETFLRLLLGEEGATAGVAAADREGSGRRSTQGRPTNASPRQLSQLVERLDRDRDGRLSRDEIPAKMAFIRRHFDRLDRDGDGALSLDEASVRPREGTAGAWSGGQAPKSGATVPPPETHRGGSGDERVVVMSPPGESYIDPEILSSHRLMTFVRGRGREVWVGRIDGKSGLFQSVDGRDILIDTGTARLSETFNGPEFGVDAGGWSIVYAKPVDGTPQVWMARVGKDGVQRRAVTSGERHQTARASKAPGAKGTGVVMIRGTWRDGKAVWMDTESSGAAQALHEIVPGVISASWVRGEKRIATVVKEARGDLQAFLVDPSTGHRVQISTGRAEKDDPYVWRAPDFGNDLLAVMVEDKKRLVVYRESTPERWERIAMLGIPKGSRHGIIGSAEPFVWAGRSYVSAATKSDAARIGRFEDGEIWILPIAGGTAGRGAFRCDGGEYPLPRFDPETFVGDDDAFVYYSSIRDGRFRIERCRVGLRGG